MQSNQIKQTFAFDIGRMKSRRPKRELFTSTARRVFECFLDGFFKGGNGKSLEEKSLPKSFANQTQGYTSKTPQDADGEFAGSQFSRP